MCAYRRIIWITIAALLGVVAMRQVSIADDRERHHKDHDLARQAVERGEVMPLESVLAEVRKSVSGEVAGVELERENGTWLYEIKIIAAGGVLTEVKVDAKTGRIVRTRGK